MASPRHLILLLIAAAAACGEDDDGLVKPDANAGGGVVINEDPKTAGDTTIFDNTREAFAKPLANLHGERRDVFFLGNAIFNRGWVIAPASVADFDGLGPLFNATNCSGCHFKDGRGRPPEKPDEAFLSLLIRLSIPGKDAHGGPNPEPAYGDQLQGNGILGVPDEGYARVAYTEISGAYADGSTFSIRQPKYTIDKLGYGPLHADTMMSPRAAPAIVGLGLLEAIPEAMIIARADPDDRDGDGISGRPNYVWDQAAGKAALGRFGWKANQPNLHQQNAAAFNGDMGITSSLFASESCSAVQTQCKAAPTGTAAPQLRDILLEQVDFYTHTLAVPGRRNVDAPNVKRGAQLFVGAGCASCHTPTMETGDLPGFPELSKHEIHPFTDLLLHDMGPELADNRPDFEATGTEWRTPPLWGVGLVRVVNRHELFMHDGRARGFAEAILWHGGEASRARDAFVKMPKADRDCLVDFLGSL